MATLEDLQAQIDRLNAMEDAVPAGPAQKLLQKKFREERRKLEARLQRTREQESLDAQSATAAQLDPFADGTPEEQAAWDKATGHINPWLINYYDHGPDRTIGDNELIQSRDMKSAAQGLDSAYGGLESAFGDLAYDPRALGDMREGAGYFGDLMRGGGRDAVSEAEYRKRTADAEQRRSAQTAAALAAEEARGGSSAGARVLAEQAASAGQIADTYSAGLDANAMAQKRRDAAAQSFFNLSHQIGDTQYGADFDRAGGLDTFAMNKAGGLDAFDLNRATALDNMTRQNEANRLNSSTYNADKYSGAADKNLDRTWEVGDANANMQNSVTTANAAADANATNTWLGAQGQESGAVLGTGNLQLGRRQQRFAESQAPGAFERFTSAAAPYISAGAGLVGQTKKWRSI